MEYRGIEYSVVQGPAGIWKWRVTVGNPLLLRLGEASSEQQAEIHVRSAIDRALAVEARLRSVRDKPATDNDA